MADRDMTGSLSRNTRKQKPSYADSITIEGRNPAPLLPGRGNRCRRGRAAGWKERAHGA